MQVGRDIELDAERAAAPLRQPCARRRISALQLAERLERLERRARPRERLGKPQCSSAQRTVSGAAALDGADECAAAAPLHRELNGI